MDLNHVTSTTDNGVPSPLLWIRILLLMPPKNPPSLIHYFTMWSYLKSSQPSFFKPVLYHFVFIWFTFNLKWGLDILPSWSSSYWFWPIMSVFWDYSEMPPSSGHLLFNIFISQLYEDIKDIHIKLVGNTGSPVSLETSLWNGSEALIST